MASSYYSGMSDRCYSPDLSLGLQEFTGFVWCVSLANGAVLTPAQTFPDFVMENLSLQPLYCISASSLTYLV